MQHGRVVIICQQHPCLDLLSVSEQVVLRVELYLIGFLGRIGEGAVAASLELSKAAVINDAAVRSDKEHLAGGRVILACVNIFAALVRRVITCDEHGRSRGFAYRYLLAELTVGQGDGVSAVDRGGDCLDIEAAAKLCAAAITRDAQLAADTVGIYYELAHIGACGKQQEEAVIGLGKHNGPAVKHRAAYIVCRGRFEAHVDRGGVAGAVILLAVSLCAAIHTEAVASLGKAGHGVFRFAGDLHNIPLFRVGVILLEYILLSTGCLVPAHFNAVGRGLGCLEPAHICRQDLEFKRQRSVEIAAALKAHGTYADIHVAAVGLVGVLAGTVAAYAEGPSLIGESNGGVDPAARVGVVLAVFCFNAVDIYAHSAAGLADMVFIPVMSRAPCGRAGVACSAGLAFCVVVSVFGAGSGVAGNGLMEDTVVTCVDSLLAPLEPAGLYASLSKDDLILGATLDLEHTAHSARLRAEFLAADGAGEGLVFHVILAVSGKAVISLLAVGFLYGIAVQQSPVILVCVYEHLVGISLNGQVHSAVLRMRDRLCEVILRMIFVVL